MRKVVGNGLGTTLGPLTGPWGTIMVILGVILRVILRVVYVILMTEMVLEGESYEKSCWKWSRNHCGTTARSMGNHHVILGVIYG